MGIHGISWAHMGVNGNPSISGRRANIQIARNPPFRGAAAIVARHRPENVTLLYAEITAKIRSLYVLMMDNFGIGEVLRQTACKPGSVHRPEGRGMAIHLGRPLPDASRDLPERRRRNAPGPRRTCRPYSVLLPVGFTVPPPSPGARCALTAPFHPCRAGPGLEGPRPARRSALCGTFPGVAPAGRYPAPCSRGARTFLPRALRREGGHPAVWRPPDVGPARASVNVVRQAAVTGPVILSAAKDLDPPSSIRSTAPCSQGGTADSHPRSPWLRVRPRRLGSPSPRFVGAGRIEILHWRSG